MVVPSRNRPDAAAETLRGVLISAEEVGAEVVAVDDGSTPPLSFPHHDLLRIIRTPGIERSRARNLGACVANSELIIFVDDDITVAPDFVGRHIRGAGDFGNVITVGSIVLAEGSVASPFGRFRQGIEMAGPKRQRGLVEEANFCTAGNMSIRREAFLALGGFDPAILSGEDQDLALRFSSCGGRIAFLPDAEATHRDSISDIWAYGRRHEWGARAMAPFIRRYPNREDNQARLTTGMSLAAARSPRERARIALWHGLSSEPCLAILHALAIVTERAGANDTTLFFLYRALLGLRLFRGYQLGLAAVLAPPPLPTPLDPATRAT